MKNNYDDLDKALNVESSIVEVEETPKSLDVSLLQIVSSMST